MASRKDHTEVGGNIGLTEYMKWIEAEGRPYNFWEARLCMLVGSKAAELPDIIEPATDPTHRGPAHSYELNFLLCLAMENMSNSDEQGFSNLLWRIGLKGYGSHLSLDQQTKMGLYSVIGNIVTRFFEKIAG